MLIAASTAAAESAVDGKVFVDLTDEDFYEHINLNTLQAKHTTHIALHTRRAHTHAQ